MGSLLSQLLGRQPKSAYQAKERMKLVLIHDRTDIAPDTLAAIKDELISLISRHVEVDEAAVKFEMTQDGRTQRLIADIPIRAAKRRRLG